MEPMLELDYVLLNTDLSHNTYYKGKNMLQMQHMKSRKVFTKFASGIMQALPQGLVCIMQELVST